MPHREIIEDICGHCENYCTLKEILLHSGMNDRLLVQLKCIEKFKFERSKGEGRNIEWKGAHELWVTEGYAERFDEVYKEGMTYEKIWEAIFGCKE